MPNNICVELFDEIDEDLTVRVTADVVGKTFADISADIQSGPDITTTALPTTWDGGNFQAATCAAGAKQIGVFAYDAASGKAVPVKAPGKIVPVTAGAAITAGDEVAVGANGKAVPASSGTAAHLDTGVVGSNNAITWTAREVGTPANSLTVTIVDPGGTTASLSVDVDGNDIIVSLARASSAITSTADDVKAAVLEHDTASQLVTTADKSTSDGSGLMAAVAKTNLAGGLDATNGVPAGKAYTSAGNGDDCYVRVYA